MQKLAVVFTALFCFSAWVRGDAYQKTAQGIDLKIGDAQVELAAATPTAFRLSVSYDGPATTIATTFLDPSANSTSLPWQVATQGNLVGIKSDAGELLIDPNTGDWTLLNAQGSTVIPLSPLGKLQSLPSSTPTITVGAVDPKLHKWVALTLPDPDAKPDTSCVNFSLRTGSSAPVKVFGCGNGAPTLQQSKADSKTANGVAIIPYYWSPTGYSVLGVTANDEKPATWKTAADQSSFDWRFLGKRADLYLMPASSLRDAARAYSQLTGFAPVPPRWTFGYIQCKWGWKNRAFIEDTLKQFLDRHIPVDAFFFDFEWYTPQNDYELIQGKPGFPDFSWNPATFPEPEKQIDDYRAKGIHFVGIRKPRMGDADHLQLMRDKGWLLHPGLQVVDPSPIVHVGNFGNADFRAWYAQQLQPLLQKNIYGWWNDEGDGLFGSFVTYFNWNVAESAAMAQAKPGRRHWTLNRSFSPGMQRLGTASWTGDIQARWDVLQSTPRVLLNWSLAGMPYSTCDIGGYSPETNAQLLTRWMEAGVFFPVLHTHSETGRTPHFPWLWGPDAEKAITKAIDLRYQFIPYFYSLAYETHKTGLPFMRPLVMEFPDDPKVTEMTDEWLVGSRLLAAPILDPSTVRSVYLPADDWFRFNTSDKVAGGQTVQVNAAFDEIPAYVRAGTILLLGPVVQNTDAMPGGPLEVQIYPGKDATFTLAEDDGETTDYLNGAVRKTTFTWNDAARKLTWAVSGTYTGTHCYQNLSVVVFDPGAKSSEPMTTALTATGSLNLPR